MPKIEYELIRTQRRTLAIVVNPDASVVVRAPLRMPMREIAAFLEDKRRWIEGKRALMLRRLDAHGPRELTSGEEVPYLGGKLMLAITDRVKRAQREGCTLALPKAPPAEVEAMLRRWYAGEAARVFTERVNRWMERTGIYAASLGVTGARRRWGSCSAKGALNFAWRLVMAPADVIDYVVVHELAHIEHPNHSKAFWGRVGQIMPDYATKRKWLRENSALLKLF